jgi:hypothetical protein
MPGSLNICFTWNNPPVTVDGGNVVQPRFLEDEMEYLVYQYEMGANGTPHWQGYVEFKRRRTYNQARELLQAPGAACFNRRGSQQQAIDYCKKMETRVEGATPFEHGTPKMTNQGQRNDLVEFKEAIKEGKRKRDLVDEHTTCMAKYGRFYDTVRGLYRPERTEARRTYLLIGPPRCGKTRSVMEQHRGEKRHELFDMPLSNGTMWHDGYDGHSHVLIDDFAGAASHITLTNFLRLIDPWNPVQVPIKGGFVWWDPDVIYITTNIWPREWYKWENRVIQYRAMAERFRAVFDFYEYEIGGDPPVGDNERLPYIHESYITHGISLVGCRAPPRYEGKDWWIRERPDDATPW